MVPLLAFQAACGSDQALPTTPGSSVFSPEVTQASLRSLGGGFGPLTPDGAACQLGVATFTVVLGPPTLTFSRCQVVGDYSVAASYMPQSGQIPLNPAQLATVRAALGAVTVSNKRTCGADKGTVELEMSTLTQSLTYGDDFYGCLPNYKAFVDTQALDNLYSVLDGLAS
jgi:hypothetical protein